MEYGDKRILIVAPDLPYPPNHGARLDIWGRILALRQIGYTIDLAATVKKPPLDADLDAVRAAIGGEVMICLRRRRILDLLSRLPFQAKSRSRLKTLSLAGSYDVVLLESEYGASVLANPSLQANKIVLRIHNDEKHYLRELSRSVRPGIHKLYYRIESHKCGWLKTVVNAQVNNMMFISVDEYEEFVHRLPDKNAIFLPPPLPPKVAGSSAGSSRTVLFIGSLFMANNREAVDWYVSKVHPQLADIDGYKLVVAGNTQGSNRRWCEKLAVAPRVAFVDSPDNLGRLYEASGLFVNPMLHGAGVKLKAIDAIVNGLPVVSTSVGVQGTGLHDGRHVAVADDPAAFAARARELVLSPEVRTAMVDRAQQYLNKYYNQGELLKKYLASLI